MRRRKVLHIVWSIIIIVFYFLWLLVTAIDTNLKYLNTILQRVIAILPILGSLFVYAYNNFNGFFTITRRVCAYLVNDTVSLTNRYRVFLPSDTDFNQVITDFKSDIDIEIVKCKQNSDYIFLKICKKGIYADLRLNYSKYSEDSIELVFDMIATIAYRDSEKVTNLFFEIIHTLQTITPALYKMAENENIKVKNPLMSSTINMQKYNPFYKYIVKHISFDKESKFSKMYITDSNTNIKIKNHAMTIETNDEKVLEEILKNYISISTIG